MDRILTVPTTVFLDLTRQCNLRCLHCSADGGHVRYEELTTAKLLDFIQILTRAKVFRVIVTGGEPLIRDDFFTLLQTMRKNQSVILNTNATLVTEDIACRLSEFNVFLISVSLDGSSPEIHDCNRGQGSFQRAVHGIKLLLKHGCRVSISTVVTRINYKDVVNIIKLAKELGVERIGLNHVHTIGRGQENKERIVPSFEEDQWIGAEIFKASQEFGSFVGSWYIDQVRLYNSIPTTRGESNFISPCSAAKQTIAIASNGDVIPCTNLRKLVCGNIRHDDFIKVWQRSQVLADFRSLSTAKVDSIEGCRDCNLVGICSGGCRADAYAEYGSFTAPYPFCQKNPVNHAKGARHVKT